MRASEEFLHQFSRGAELKNPDNKVDAAEVRNAIKGELEMPR